MTPLPISTPFRLTILGLALAVGPAAHAQFSPYGSATINNMTTAAQTLTSGTGTITASGTISVSSTSVSLTLSGTGTTLSNLGTITNTNAGASGNPRALLADGTNLQITNGASGQSGGLIQSTGNDAVRSSTGTTSITFTNYGTVSALNSTATSPQQAVDWNSITTGANTFNNYGTVQATGNDAIRPGVNGVISNFAGGMITSANTTNSGAIAAGNGLSSDGIDAQTNTGVQVTNTGTITGGRHGITGGNTTGTGAYAITITNNANATIQGSNGGGLNIDGINGNELATIVNNGTITGNGSALNGANTTQDGDGVDVDGLVNLNNTGTIRSLNAIGDTSEGVTVGGGTIINNAGATIRGSVASGNTSNAVGRGITIAGVDKDSGGNTIPVQAPYAATTITNSGLIRGDTDSAIAYTSTLTSGFSHTLNNNAGGVLEGGGATVAAVLLGPDNDTINNAGRIVADSSNLAIDMGGGNNTLNITGGVASIVGNVSGGTGGTNALTITPGTGNTFAYAGSFSNFATVQVNAGTTTLSGDSTYTGTTTVANGAALVAANNAANGGSATGTGAVTVQSGGTLAGTGRIGGSVTLASGGRISPSNQGSLTPGLLTLGGDLSTTGGSRFAFTLGANTAASDRLLVNGTLNFTGTTTDKLFFDVLNGGGLATGRYDLVDFGTLSGLSVGNLALGNVPNGFTGTFDITGNSIGLTVSSVPEPATTQALLAGGVLLLGGMAWRRSRPQRRTTSPARSEVALG